jgi:sterol desaturase/sphingolipid hydroxylase (fatty acid hydroxylase superfamily)
MVLVSIGIPLEAITVAGAVFYTWGMFIHSNLNVNLRPLEAILVTPRLHRMHHDSNSTARNLGNVFTIWDRLLGRLDDRESGAEVVFGVPGEVNTYPQSWFPQFLEPLRRRNDSISTADHRRALEIR